MSFLSRLLLRRSLVFRLWLAVNVIFLVAALAGTAVYVWTSVDDEIDQARAEVRVRQESLQVFSDMAQRVLRADGTFVFSDADFAMLRNLGVYESNLFDEQGVHILKIDPWQEEVSVTPEYAAFIQSFTGDQQRGSQPMLPPRVTMVENLGTLRIGEEFIQGVHAAGMTRRTIEVTVEGDSFSTAYASFSPSDVIQGRQFGEELWTSRGTQVQQAYFAIPDLQDDARALMVNASLVLLLVFVATSAACWFLLRHLIYRPLTHYSSIAALIAQGEPLRMPATGHDEMVGLARAVNDMADALESKASIDSLTGLYNHRHLNEELANLLGNARLSNEPMAVLIADLDEFKQINDTYGHYAGDSALCEVAKVMLEWAGGTYICWRLGGDEFAAALPGLTRSEARMETTRLQSMIEQLAIAVPGGSVRTSLSAGVACYPQDGQTPVALLNAADAAMYAEKESRVRAGLERIAG